MGEFNDKSIKSDLLFDRIDDDFITGLHYRMRIWQSAVLSSIQYLRTKYISTSEPST